MTREVMVWSSKMPESAATLIQSQQSAAAHAIMRCGDARTPPLLVSSAELPSPKQGERKKQSVLIIILKLKVEVDVPVR